MPDLAPELLEVFKTAVNLLGQPHVTTMIVAIAPWVFKGWVAWVRRKKP